LQIHFALSNITSWHTVDGDFDYQIFWDNIVDFFEDTLGPVAQARVRELLEWWTRSVINHHWLTWIANSLYRKVFRRNYREDLTMDVVSQMSVSALTAQRQEMENAIFDSD
jgi:hypothetical protein